ncbi:hypothetical protein AB0J47_02575 [Nocardia sp. NPDC049737]|uniref:hypothetical protein n=1 Tax=Nocardia sp. NPDC049737 TaxID=3154358 RepID=UPI003426024E
MNEPLRDPVEMHDKSLSPKEIDRSDAISILWPTVGPYTADSIITAASGIAELWRYLAHATLRADSKALADPADVYVAVGSLTAAAHSAEQVCRQLSVWAGRLASDSDLTHDAHRGERWWAINAATDAAEWLNEARALMELVGREFGHVSTDLGHLYVDSEADEEGQR